MVRYLVYSARGIGGGRRLWLAALIFAACSERDASAPPVVLPPGRGVRGISVSPSSATLRVGDTLRFRATVTGLMGQDTTVVWASSRADVAGIDSMRGQAQALSVGSATLTATVRSNNNYKAGAQLVVIP